MNENYNVVDLFCGVGGLTHGFRQENFNVVAGIDFDKSCKFSYERNNDAKFLLKDLTITSAKEIANLFPKNGLKILVGCAPCQAFSMLSQKYKQNDKWKLLYSFGRIIEEIRPDVLSMENVESLTRYKNGKVFADFLAILDKAKYKVFYKVVNAAEYGVPQSRHRLILLASRLGKISLIEPTHSIGKFVTVRQAIGHLRQLDAGQIDKKDPLHRSRSLSPLNKKRMLATPEGGGWKDWPQRLVLDCHKREGGQTYRSVYGRMWWDDVSPTLTTQCTGYGNGRYGHPVQHRAISLREAAILQSFPESYKFIESEDEVSVKALERHIGNAVPVELGRAIAKSISVHLQKYAGRKKI